MTIVQGKPLGDFIGEVFQLTNAAGNVLEFNQAIYLPVYTNFGVPRVNYITRQGYKQDGSTPLDAILGERFLSITLFHEETLTRDAWWELRRSLVQFFRPEIGKPITLTILQPSGKLFSIDVYADPGPEFATPIESNEWNLQERIALRAFNPLWFKSPSISNDLVATEDTQLVFPITFPITFGIAGVAFTTGDLNYQGSWKSYPKITLTGPYTTATLRLINTDISIQLLSAIVIGQKRILDTDPSRISLVDELGNSRFNELSLPSNILDFFIPASPEGLTEVINITLLNGIVDTSGVLIEYRENYLGI